MRSPNISFFDYASTTCCTEAALGRLQHFTRECFGNPSSSHRLGQEAARAIHEARAAFAEFFKVEPGQVFFTGSGTESDNHALYGIALPLLARRLQNPSRFPLPPRILYSAIEHAAVRKTAESLSELGFEVKQIPVTPSAEIDRDKLLELLTPETAIVSVMQVNNIVGTILPIEDLARMVKKKVPGAVFHTDAVQGFGKISHPFAPSAIDLVSLSGHKVHGPKGVGALIVMNRELIDKKRLRPLVWGGGQEQGQRSGTQNAGLISGFHFATLECIENMQTTWAYVSSLHEALHQALIESCLINTPGAPLHWCSPKEAIPHIVCLSAPGLPTGPLTRFLEERGCIVSSGSACSSSKSNPEPVLIAMGLPQAHAESSIRISFSINNKPSEIPHLIDALGASIHTVTRLLGRKST